MAQSGLLREELTQLYLEEYIKTYGYVTYDHITRIMQKNEFRPNTIERYHRALRKATRSENGRRYNSGIIYDHKEKTYYCYNFIDPGKVHKQRMGKIQWIIIDFLNQAEIHTPHSRVYQPVLATLMVGDRSYELVYAKAGEEQYLERNLFLLRRKLIESMEELTVEHGKLSYEQQRHKERIEATKYIILLDDIEKAPLIKCSQTAFFCTLDSKNRPQYFTPEEVAPEEVAE